MKGLLHSKKFKNNLFKWIFMYIMTIGLFTSVVTYSKYISNMNSDDTARVALFDAAITYDGICSGKLENERCDIGKFRPTSNISYYFTVDNRNLEVSTIFLTRITVLDVFKDIKIYDITAGEVEIPIKMLSEITDEDDFVFIQDGNILTLTEDVLVNETYVRKYKITMNFDYNSYDANHSNELSFVDAVTVGYSATQIK